MAAKHKATARGPARLKRHRRHLLAMLVTLLAVLVAGTGSSTAALPPPIPGEAPMIITERGSEIRHDGYVAVTDGTLLRVQVDRPVAFPQVPTLLVYHGYTHQIDAAYDPRVGLQDWATENGYALMMASPRGTGCSAGAWDFLAEQEALDAHALIDWVTAQSWSDGKVAMIGGSYSGFEQLRVAARAPTGLVAISPAAPVTDLYRDVAAPGGIPNAHLPAAFTGAVTLPLIMGSPGWRPDPPVLAAYCTVHQAEHLTKPSGTPAVLLATRWDNDVLRDRSPARDDVALPMLTLISWQDDTLGSRPIDALARMSGPLHAVLTNGGHEGAWKSPVFQERLRAFLDFYVKGVDNGFSDSSPIQVWWDTHKVETDQQPPLSVDSPGWVEGLPRFPAPNLKMTELYLSEDGALSRTTGTGGPDRYTSEPGSGQGRGHRLYPNPWPDWSAPAGEGRSLAYTTAPLAKEMTVLGSGSLDLWLESAQPDTDVQVVVTELRPDGNEVYVQAGWLRASHRTEDPQQSTATRPFHTHLEVDEVPLTPGTPELLRVEIPPFGHVFRAGSALRIWIEAPAATFGVRSFEPLPYSSDNAVHHDAQRPSVLRLSTLPGERAQDDRPECVPEVPWLGKGPPPPLSYYPCRPDPLAP